MADIHLTMGVNDYDHVRDIFTGAVGVAALPLALFIE